MRAQGKGDIRDRQRGHLKVMGSLKGEKQLNEDTKGRLELAC